MKKRLFVLPLIAVSMFLSIGAFNNYSHQEANAAYETKKSFEDNFDSNEIDDEKWSIQGDVSYVQHYSSMRFKPAVYDWTSSMNLNQRFSGDYKVRMELSTQKMGGWFAIAFGNTGAGAAFPNSKGGIVFFDGELAQVLDIPETKLDALGEYRGVSAFGSNIDTKRVVEISIKKIDDNHSSMQCEVFESGVSLGTIFDTPYVLNCLDGYMGFNDNLKQVEIYNIEVLDGSNQRLYYDNFSSSSVLYPTSGSSTAMWHTSFSEEELKVGYVNSLYLEKDGATAVCNYPLAEVENKELSVAYQIEAEAKYSLMSTGVRSGIEIGRNEGRGYFFGLKRLVYGYSLVYYDSFKDEERVIGPADENSDLVVNMSLIIYQNGNVHFNCGNVEIDVKNIKYVGSVALINEKIDESVLSDAGLFINYFKIYKDGYYKRDNADIYMNFNGTKETYFEDIDETVSDYFISKKEWSIGTNVTTSKWRTKDNGNGKLEFNSAGIASFFGPRKLYKDFIVKFDVEITNKILPLGGIVGLEFGIPRVGMYYDNAKSLGIGYFKNNNGEYATYPSIHNMDYAPGAKEEMRDENDNLMNIFDNNGKFTMMFVGRNDVVSLYLLLNEEESTFTRLVTTVICREGESIDGYLAIFGIGDLSFTVDNLSIINLDLDTPANEYQGTTNYQEVTRLDFTSSNSLKGMTVNNAAYVDNKYRVSNGGEIKTTKLVNDFIVRNKVNKIEDTLLIEQDSLKINFVNKTEKYIEINDGENVQRRNLDSRFLFDNSLIEVEKKGTNLNIRLSGGNEPLSRFEESLMSFEIAPTNESELSIKGVNGYVDLDGITFINLNKYVTISNRNYNKDTDEFNPWIERDTEEDSKGGNNNKKGCSGSFTPMSLMILGISLIGLVGVSIYRRRKE